MPFHRLAAATYFGGLPGTHDRINDPAANGSPGASSPADGVLSVSGHPNEGTYFVGFGDDGSAFNANRPHVALAENTDFLDDLFHADLAKPSFINKNGIAAAQITINTVTDLGGVPIFVGPSGTANTQAGLAPYFRITDQSDEDLVNGNPTNVQIVVTSVSPGGAVGTFFSGTLTLNLNTIPANSSTRVHFGIRSSLAEIGPEALILAGTTAAQEGQQSFIRFRNDLARQASTTLGAQLVGVDTALFTTNILTGTTGGGIGTTGLATIRDVLGAVDVRLRARRAFTAVWTDGTNSFGGDFEQIDIDDVVDGTFSGGAFMFRRGAYEISNSVTQWTDTVRIVGESTGSFITNPSIRLNSTRVSNLIVRGNIELDNVNLVTDSTTAKYQFTASGNPGSFIMRRGTVEAGALQLLGGTFANYYEFEDVSLLPHAAFTGSVASWDHSQEGRAVYRRCRFDQIVTGGTRIFHLHDVVNDALSSIVFEECEFEAGFDTTPPLVIEGMRVPVTFRNCYFKTIGGGGLAFAVDISTSKNILFDGCVFEGDNGRCVRNLDSAVEFRNCVFRDGGVPVAADNPQIIVGHGSLFGSDDEEALRIHDCVIEYNTAAVRNGGSDTPTLPFVELGGNNKIAMAGRVIVRGLHIRPADGFSGGSHKFTSVLLHGYVGANQNGNIYKDIVFDTGLQVPDVTGAGLAGVFDTGEPAFVEVGTAGTPVRELTTVKGLSVVNIRIPDAAGLARRLLVLDSCIAYDVVVSSPGTGGVGSFSTPLVQLQGSEVYGLYLFGTPNQDVPTSGSFLLLTEGSKVYGGRINSGNNTTEPLFTIRMPGNFSELHDVHHIVENNAFPLANPILASTGTYCVVSGCTFLLDGDPGNTVVPFQFLDTEARVHGNTFRWDRNGADDLLSSTGARCLVAANQILSTAATAPTATITGTDTVSANNVLAANADSSTS